MGFWIFSTTKDLKTNLLKIVYEDNFMITISTDTDLYGYCFTGLEYQNIESSLTNPTTLSSFLTGAGASTFNYLKTAKITEQKWNYVRCGYSYKNMKIYNDVNLNGFLNTNLKSATLKSAPYFKDANIFVPPRKFIITNPKLKISKLSGLTSADSVFIRNLVLFSDYIHPNIYIHYM